MTNITKLEFKALDLTRKNYLSWILDVEIHVVSINLGDTIKKGNELSHQDRAKELIFLRHHLNDGLKVEYLTVKEPRELWKNLKERFDHQRTQYRECGFQRYSELISCLLVVEQNNELLMKNHQMRPNESTQFPKANGTTFLEEYEIEFPDANANSTQNHNNESERGRERGRS
ncbi:uncharacterized protein LOC142531754 [Primulina tabacum]|uniref:uncharacterized protein LOC142531754 n=1 Tax=Primulina tabacum TaxID=48773 RepID=UPI003F59AB07